MAEQTYVSTKSLNNYSLWKEGLPLLSHVDIELTERCNNNCIHCSICQPEDAADILRRELSTAEVKAILAEAADLGALSVRFTGGEPLLRQDFAEIYLAARRLGLKVILFTNATLITPELTDLFLKVPAMERMEITVYGMSETSYEAVTRKQGSYALFSKGLELLLANKIPFIVKGAVLPPTISELELFAEWASRLPFMKIAPDLAMLFNLRDRRDSEQKNATINELRISPSEYIRILHLSNKINMAELLQFCGRHIGPPGADIFSCGAGRKLCIDPYGTAQLCLPLRHPDTLYPLAKASLETILTVVFPEMLSMKARNPEYLARCAVCFLKGLCEQCPAKSWSEHGTLDTPVEYFCSIAHALAEEIGLIKKGELGWNVKEWQLRVARLQQKLL